MTDSTPEDTTEDTASDGQKFALYDVSLQRFVGPVHASKKDVTEWRKGADLNKSHKFETRAIDV